MSLSPTRKSLSKSPEMTLIPKPVNSTAPAPSKGAFSALSIDPTTSRRSGSNAPHLWKVFIQKIHDAWGTLVTDRDTKYFLTMFRTFARLFTSLQPKQQKNLLPLYTKILYKVVLYNERKRLYSMIIEADEYFVDAKMISNPDDISDYNQALTTIRKKNTKN